MVKIVGISGSLREGSYSFSALNLVAQRLSALGASVEIIDLRSLNLPFCDGGKDYSAYPDVGHWYRLVGR
jgi:FMN reductase